MTFGVGTTFYQVLVPTNCFFSANSIYKVKWQVMSPDKPT